MFNSFITLFLANSRVSSFLKGERGDTEQISLTTLPSGITRVADTIAFCRFDRWESEVHGQQLNSKYEAYELFPVKMVLKNTPSPSPSQNVLNGVELGI